MLRKAKPLLFIIYYSLLVYADTYINVTATTFLLGDTKGILGATEDKTLYSVVD